jgi:hypothetical protein
MSLCEMCNQCQIPGTSEMLSLLKMNSAHHYYLNIYIFYLEILIRKGLLEFNCFLHISEQNIKRFVICCILYSLHV